ncbi:MAG: hypothetical protein LBB13_00120 [Rickettsiales bacterium]|jgi:hypothetical protein|nr:hypothetical protein [Rickettsiales bacterium]
MSDLVAGSGAISDIFPLTNWILAILVMTSVLDSNLSQTKGLAGICRKPRSGRFVFLFFAGLFTTNILFSWYSYGGRLQWNTLDCVEYVKISDYRMFLLPILLSLLYRLRIPFNLTFVNRTIFTGKNLVYELLLKTLLNYFVSLGISMIFWRLVHGKFERNPTAANSKFWFIVQCLSIGILWYNLLNAFMPNFAIYIPRKINLRGLVAFIFSILVALAIAIGDMYFFRRNLSISGNEQLDFRLSSMFNALYISVILLFAHFTTISIITSWISLGLRSGMKIAVENIELKFRPSLEKILRDIHVIFVGMLVAIIFTKIIRI